MSEVAAKVTKIIVDQLGVSAEEVKPEASFVEDLGADSLDLTELIMAMEEEFDIEIADDDAQKILKVQDAISYIESKPKFFPVCRKNWNAPGLPGAFSPSGRPTEHFFQAQDPACPRSIHESSARCHHWSFRHHPPGQ